MIEKDLARDKLIFFSAWTIINAAGLGLGWSLGEYFGRQIGVSFGWRIGQVFGILFCEGILWLFRGIVFSRLTKYRILKPLDSIIWITAELFGWVVSEFPVDKNSLMAITGGTLFASISGAIIWLTFWFIKMPKAKTKLLWALKAAAWGFAAFIIGNLFTSILFTSSLQFGYFMTKMGLPYLGMAIAGFFLGALLGALTGLAMIRFLRGPEWES